MSGISWSKRRGFTCNVQQGFFENGLRRRRVGPFSREARYSQLRTSPSLHHHRTLATTVSRARIRFLSLHSQDRIHAERARKGRRNGGPFVTTLTMPLIPRTTGGDDCS